MFSISTLTNVFLALLSMAATCTVSVHSFSVHTPLISTSASSRQVHSQNFHAQQHVNFQVLHMANNDNDGVVELADDDEDAAPVTVTVLESESAPFLSQGGISEDALNPDLSDPKQTRVIIYIILSLIPVLFLIPLMLGSRDLIPLDALPPVDM